MLSSSTFYIDKKHKLKIINVLSATHLHFFGTSYREICWQFYICIYNGVFNIRISFLLCGFLAYFLKLYACVKLLCALITSLRSTTNLWCRQIYLYVDALYWYSSKCMSMFIEVFLSLLGKPLHFINCD